VNPNSCPRCGGSGYIAQSVDIRGKSEGVAFIRVKCPACGGSGRNDSIPPTAGWPHGLWCLRRRAGPDVTDSRRGGAPGRTLLPKSPI